MTKNNEQIIIDGVDVGKCYHISKEQDEYICKMYYNENCDCDIRTDCHYKQLKRKEQECEELKEKLEKAGSNLFLTNQALNEYKKEIIKLKEENEKLTHELYGQEKIINRLIKQVDNQKQTLEEIREIAGELLQTKIPFCTIHEKIIEKINEVIDEN